MGERFARCLRQLEGLWSDRCFRADYAAKHAVIGELAAPLNKESPRRGQAPSGETEGMQAKRKAAREQLKTLPNPCCEMTPDQIATILEFMGLTSSIAHEFVHLHVKSYDAADELAMVAREHMASTSMLARVVASAVKHHAETWCDTSDMP
jgi:hypothetical protein